MLTEPAKQRCFLHSRFWRLLTYPLDKETENLIIYLENCFEEHRVGVSVNQRLQGRHICIVAMYLPMAYCGQHESAFEEHTADQFTKSPRLRLLCVC